MINMQIQANIIGAEYETFVEDHLVENGACILARHICGVDLVVRWRDGKVEHIECKADGSKGGLAQCRSAKEAFAMAHLHKIETGYPVTIYSGRLPTPGTVADRIVTLGIAQGVLTPPVQL